MSENQNEQQKQVLYDLQANYNYECVLIKEPPLGVIPVTNLMWRSGDWDTLNIISAEYHNDIRKGIVTLFENNIIKKKTVIQAGGNSGLYPILFTEFFDLVFTFEPNSKNFHCLVNNCQQDNIIKFNCALGSKNGRVKSIELVNSNYGMNKVEEIKEDVYIPMVSLDSLGLTDIGLIQLDTEGYELEILKGAVELIKESKPAIMLEINDSLLDEITEFLKTIDYHLYTKISRVDYVFVDKETLSSL